MRIVFARPDDQAAIVALWEACGLTRPWNDPARDYALALETATSTILAGWGADHVVASVMVGFEGHRGWVYYLAVSPERRRKGHGVAMMRAAEDWLQGQGAPKIQLMVREDNLPTLAFYEALGFERQKVVTLGRFLAKDRP
jgi:ribosomal protein S18 acetylase RimI-like enzyme